METKTIQELGIDLWHPESIEWRHPWKEDFKSGVLKGKPFRIGRQRKTMRDHRHICIDADWVSNKKPAIITYKYGTIEAKATFFQLPTRIQKTKDEIKSEIRSKYPKCELNVPKQGCQLHGDIDATLILKNGDKYTIPWNY